MSEFVENPAWKHAQFVSIAELSACQDKLSAANERIRRMEAAGKELRQCAAQFGYTSTDDPRWIARAERAVETWDREAKP